MARRAKCLTILVNETNSLFPKRDKASDGWLGDPAHAARKSDHNPDENGVVRAQDIDEDLTPDNHYAMEAIVQYVVGLGAAGDSRLNPDGYVIYEGRIWSAARNWQERPYTGANAHAKHAHISCGSRPSGFDRVDPWGIASLFAPPPPPLPNPPQEDEDVPYVANPVTDQDPGQYLVVGNTMVPLGHPDEAQQLRNSGLQTKDFEPLAWALMKATLTEVPHP
jgi:hypothetical protein